MTYPSMTPEHLAKVLRHFLSGPPMVYVLTEPIRTEELDLLWPELPLGSFLANSLEDGCRMLEARDSRFGGVIVLSQSWDRDHADQITRAVQSKGTFFVAFLLDDDVDPHGTSTPDRALRADVMEWQIDGTLRVLVGLVVSTKRNKWSQKLETAWVGYCQYLRDSSPSL